MLRVIIELVPGGYGPHRRTIASMNIGNMSDLADVSDYRIDAMEAASLPPKWSRAGSSAPST